MMPRKKSTPVISPFAFGAADIKGLARDATYVIKWNAPLAIKWMDGISGRIISESEKKVYNDAAIKINSYLDYLEKMISFYFIFNYTFTFYFLFHNIIIF